MQINKLSEYVEYVSQLKPLKANKKIYKNSLFFRGLNDANYDLSPSLGRKVTGNWVNTYTRVESDLIETAQLHYPEEFGMQKNPVLVLAKLQHYGIYTRLMDITSNPLIALYFACKGNNKHAGKVVVLSGRCVNAYNSYACAIADTCKIAGNAITNVEDFYECIKKKDYFNNVDNDLEVFENLISSHLFVDPGFISQRQINQSGKFLLFPNKIINGKIQEDLLSLDDKNKCFLDTIIIDPDKKSGLLKELCKFGITDSFIFPDNLDKNCESIVQEQIERFKED